MNVKVVLLSIFLLLLVISGGIYALYNVPDAPSQEMLGVSSQRDVVQYPLNPTTVLDVKADVLPEFLVDLRDGKFSKIIKATKDTLSEYVSVNIVHDSYAAANIKSEISTDAGSKKLTVRPSSIPAFKPGLYKMLIKLRTIEGEVDIEQDFSWGVLAVNTNKSVYSTGEKVKIGIGVLDEKGQTQCLFGFNHVTALEMTITDPKGVSASFDIEDKTIKDSGECGATSVTNTADFLAEYSTTTETGIYQMEVEANVKGKVRRIIDYFKVDNTIPFDIERTSYPTRIYPFSIYPTTMTIIPKQDFQGEITDVVPAFFEISNVNNDGVVEAVDDYKVIRWNVSLKAEQKLELSYFIKFPPVSPEFYLIGPVTVGSYQDQGQWQIASDAINSTSGVATYEDNGASATWARIWTGTAFLSQANMDTSPADSRWFKMVSSPKTGEKIVALQDNVGSNDRLFVFRWDGSTWSEDMNINLNSTATDDTRSFDVVYEELSGEALLVYRDGVSSQLLYYHRSGGSWSGPSNAGTAYDTYKRWVRMEAQFESDSILVGYLNDNERVGAMIWDGSSDTFTNQLPDNAGSTTRDSTEQSFDIAWETQSGTPMIFWSTSSNDVIYREFSSGSWQSEATLYSGFSNDVEWVTAAADPLPTSNYIAFAFQISDWDTTEETTPCEFGMWDGSATVSLPSSVTCRSDFDGRIFNVKFENDTGQAVWTYGISESGTTGNTPAYRTWTSGGGYTSSTTLTGNLSGNIESVQLHADLNTTSMIMLTCDSAGDLNHFEWDGTSWTDVTTDLHSNIQNSGENAEAYGFGFDRNLERQVAYRWFANSGTVAVSQAIGTVDTPAQLTSANQQFRLRLLIYTSDTLSTSLRDYKLQYVDPGSGTCADPTGGTPSTWTDVPTSGGSTVSFYNNTTPADGDNLTANGSLDPTYQGLTVRAQDYEEANNFTNTVASIAADELGLWDFSLIDNTPFDRISQTYCFRVARTSDVVLQIGVYPQISTLAVDDVSIEGGTDILPGTAINNP